MAFNYTIQYIYNIPGPAFTSTLISLVTVPAALVPTHVYVPALVSVALSIVT